MAGLIASGGDLKAGIIGAATGGALGIGDTVTRIAISAVVGGIGAEIQGGSFLAGALSGGVSAGIGSTGFFAGDFDVGKLLASATVSGFVSKLGGGKFQNGAVTAALAYAVSSYAEARAEKLADQRYMEEAFAQAEAEGVFSVGSYTIAANDRVFQQCLSTCIADNYGQLYDTAGLLNPLSVIGGTTYVATGQLEKHLQNQANRNAYGSRSIKFTDKLFSAGQRQLRTLSQFRNFNAVGAVVGFGALDFQGGANAYCAVECLGSSGAAQ